MRFDLFSKALLFSLLAAISGVAQKIPAPRPVDLTAYDGVHLKGTYFAAAKPGPAVILLHQCNRERSVWNDLATRLAGAGIHVMTLDFRGFGESARPAPGEQLSAQEAARVIREDFPQDVDTAYKYLLSQPGVDPKIIGAGGASCGVNQAIQFARRHPETKSLALLSGGTDKDGRAYLRTAANLPIMMSAADDDGGVVEVMQWLMSLSPNSGDDFVRYAKGGHGVELFAPHPELPGKIVDWYRITLIKTPGKAPASTSARELHQNKPILAIIDEPGGPEKAAKLLEEARAKDPKATVFPEAIVNQLAYERMQSGDLKGAVDLAKLNVTAFPDSPNAYDSLSDAYLADGKKDLARTNAQKAIELLATNTTEPKERRDLIRNSAEQKLKQLDAEKQ